MNAAPAKVWAAALRSDKFEQTFGVITRRSNKRCCLGVAHECLVGPLTFDSYTLQPAYNAVKAALDLSWGEEAEFIRMNDVDKLTFAQIANEIDKRITPQLEYHP